MVDVKVAKETTYTFSKDDVTDLLIEQIAQRFGVDVDRHDFVWDVSDEGARYGDFGSAPDLNSVSIKVREQE
jgi:hypothetical protein